MQRSITVADRSEYSEIEKFIAGHPDGFIFHHPGWLHALEKENGQNVSCLVYRDGQGVISGILPLLLTRGLPFGIGKSAGSRRLASLPRTPFCGPLADTKQISESLVWYALEIFKHSSSNLFQYKSLDDNLVTDGTRIQKIVWRKTFEKRFPLSGEPLTFGNARNHGRIVNAVRKSRRNGITVYDTKNRDDIREWHRLYVQTMQRHLVPARSLRFFNALWDNLQSSNYFKLIIARKNGIIIAGSIFLLYNKRAFYAFNGSIHKLRSLRANDAIQWYFQHYAHEHGFRVLDLGEVAEGNEGLHAFKKKWGVESRNIYHYYFPTVQKHPEIHSEHGAFRTLLAELWMNVPTSAAARVGAFVNSFL